MMEETALEQRRPASPLAPTSASIPKPLGYIQLRSLGLSRSSQELNNIAVNQNSVSASPIAPKSETVHGLVSPTFTSPFIRSSSSTNEGHSDRLGPRLPSLETQGNTTSLALRNEHIPTPPTGASPISHLIDSSREQREVTHARPCSSRNTMESSLEENSADRPINGNDNRSHIDDAEVDSELSEPDSNLHSPGVVGLTEPEDEIVVSSNTDRASKGMSRRRSVEAGGSDDDAMAESPEEPTPHYPKRKRNSVFADLSESRLENPSIDAVKGSPASNSKPKNGRQSLGGGKCVLLGQWRDSPIPDKEARHSIIGFIDVRDRLRTRIQQFTVSGEPIGSDFPMPPGPGGSWVTFERVTFLDHLVGLDHIQVKEYVKIRADMYEDDEDERQAAERAAVKEAIRRARENPHHENPPTQLPIAYGDEMPEVVSGAGRPESKRRRVSGGFASINSSANTAADAQSEPSPRLHTQAPPLQPRPSHDPTLAGPLPGTRPTRIMMGYWAGSSELDAHDRHAVYGILGQNDMFRVKVVRETRDGRFVDGNFPTGPGALWIGYEEVEFEPHLKPLSRAEHKEYCRVRQYQLDHGEQPEDRVANEERAVIEARARVTSGYKYQPHMPPTGYQHIAPDDPDALGYFHGRVDEPRQSRRVESRLDSRPRSSMNDQDIHLASRGQTLSNDHEPRSSESRSSSRAYADGVERTNELARREIARVEAAQGRAGKHAQRRERAAALADAVAAQANADPIMAAANGRPMFHETESMQRLNDVWAKQETLRLKGSSEEVKLYDGIKYERKANGPFLGKLVSQGTIINIDGEDYVEYRVLTKPSFF